MQPAAAHSTHMHRMCAANAHTCTHAGTAGIRSHACMVVVVPPACPPRSALGARRVTRAAEEGVAGVSWRARVLVWARRSNAPEQSCAEQHTLKVAVFDQRLTAAVVDGFDVCSCHVAEHRVAVVMAQRVAGAFHVSAGCVHGG